MAVARRSPSSPYGSVLYSPDVTKKKANALTACILLRSARAHLYQRCYE